MGAPACGRARSGEPETVDPAGEPSSVGYAAPADAAAARRSAAVPARLPAAFGRYRLERLRGKGGWGRSIWPSTRSSTAPSR